MSIVWWVGVRLLATFSLLVLIAIWLKQIDDAGRRGERVELAPTGLSIACLAYLVGLFWSMP